MCLFGDGKDHASIGDPVDNALVELDVAGEEASSSGAEGMSRGHRLDGGGQPDVVEPVMVGLGDAWVVGDVLPNLVGAGVDDDGVRNGIIEMMRQAGVDDQGDQYKRDQTNVQPAASLGDSVADFDADPHEGEQQRRDDDQAYRPLF